MKNLLIVATVVVAVVSSFAQVDRSSIESLYRSPIAEVFSVRPDIDMLVVYGTDQQACVLQLEPRHTTRASDAEQTTQRLHESLDEVVPPAVRGEDKSGGVIFISGCSGMKLTDFEHVVVTETIFSKVNPTCETTMKMVVTFNTSGCNKKDLQFGPFVAKP